MRTIIYEEPNPWKYYLLNAITRNYYEVTEDEFFDIVTYDRYLIPMNRDKENINKQNFYQDNVIIGYRIRR